MQPADVRPQTRKELCWDLGGWVHREGQISENDGTRKRGLALDAQVDRLADCGEEFGGWLWQVFRTGDVV